MKNIPAILLLIIVLSLFDWSSDDVKTPTVKINEREAIGLVAFIVNSNKSDNSNTDDSVSCECNGSEYLTHGDGNRTPCPCTHNGTCRCQKTTSSVYAEEPVKEEFTKEISDQYYVVYWTASWCSVCKRWENIEKQKLIDAGIKITEIDIDRQKQTARQYNMNNTALPAFWVVRKKDIKLTNDDKYTGYMSSDQIKSAILEYHNR